MFQIQTYSQNPRLRLSDYELTENRGRLQGMPPFRISVDSSDEDSSLSSSFGQVKVNSQCNAQEEDQEKHANLLPKFKVLWEKFNFKATG